jgi:hypothetical protein
MRIQLLVCLFFFFYTFAVSGQQLSSIKLDVNQLNEIYSFSEKTNRLSENLKVQQNVKNEFSELSGFSLHEIELILSVLDPVEAKNIELTSTQLKFIQDFASQFYQNRKDDFTQVFEKNGIVHEDIAISNLKQLLVNEIKILLSKETIKYNDKNYTKSTLIKLVTSENYYDVFFSVLNQNIDDKKWDSKANFVINNGDLNLFL